MRHKLALLIVLCLPTAAVAQQMDDSRISAYRQLLTRANDELAQAMAQANALAVENARLKAEAEKQKKESGDAAPSVPKKD